MTNTYNTGNPVGSNSPQDLSDNASNFDEAMNSPSPSFVDRFGQRQETLAGMRADFQNFLIASSFESVHLTYTPGTSLAVSRATQLIDYNGSSYRVKLPASFPVTLSGVWASDQLLLTDVTDISLRQALMQSGGASMVGYGTGTVADRLDKINKTVEDYGAIGDGVSNDSASFTAMLAAEGAIKLKAKKYRIGSLALSADTVVITGQGMPNRNASGSALVNGSILLGTLTVRSKVSFFEDFGVDSGSGSGYPDGTEGFVSDAPVGQTGDFLYARNIVTNGQNAATTTHGFLFEGYNSFFVDNIAVYGRYYGVVCKSRNGSITNIRYADIGGAAVYPKSDVPAYAGNVADATVSNVKIRGVQGSAPSTNTESVGVYIHASTAVLSNVTATDITHLYGRAACLIAGGTDIYAASVTVDDVNGNSCQVAMDWFGTTYDTFVGTVRADNCKTGAAWRNSSANTGWRVDSTLNVVSDPAVTGTQAVQPGGNGSWGHVHVRNGNLTQTVPYLVSAVRPGTLSGNVLYTGDGYFSLSDNWTDGTDFQRVQLGADGQCRLTGYIRNLVSTGPVISNVISAAPAYNKTFACYGEGASAAPLTAYVELGPNGLRVISPAYTTITKIDLSGVSWKV